MSDFKVGDKVRSLKTTIWHTKGEEYEVKVVEDVGSREMIRAGEWFAYSEDFELVEDKQEFAVGDAVKVVKATIVCTEDFIGQSGVVREVSAFNGNPRVEIEGRLLWHRPEGLQKVGPIGQEIELEDVQVGDTIRCTWEEYGVTYTQEGEVAKVGMDGWAETEEGNYVTHNYNHGITTPAEHIYLIDRPEKPEPEIADGTYYVTCDMKGVGPWRVTVTDGKADWRYGEGWKNQAHGGEDTLVAVKNGKRRDMTFHTEDPSPKGFDALDKDTTYFLKDRKGPVDWYLAFLEGEWRYGNPGNIATGAGWAEDWFTTGENSWEKPVPVVLSEWEKAGVIGNRYKVKYNPTLHYKVTRKGNIKAKFVDEDSDSWEKVSWSFAHFQDKVDKGDLVKIK